MKEIIQTISGCAFIGLGASILNTAIGGNLLGYMVGVFTGILVARFVSFLTPSQGKE